MRYLGVFPEIPKFSTRLIKILALGVTPRFDAKDYLVRRTTLSIWLIILVGNFGAPVKLILFLIFGILHCILAKTLPIGIEAGGRRWRGSVGGKPSQTILQTSWIPFKPGLLFAKTFAKS